MKLFKRNILSLLSISFLFACRQNQSFETSENNSSLLWEISGNSLPQPSYFLGTMHLMCADDAVLSKNTLSIIKRVSEIYLEVDMDNISELLNGTVQLTMKDEQALNNLLSPDDYTKVKSFFDEHQPQLTFTMIERQQPLMIAASLYEIFLSCDQKNGIDVKVMEQAAKYKKETRGLETMAFQTSILDSIPYDEQAKELVKIIDDVDQYKRSMQEMVAAYIKQDVEMLHDLSSSEQAGTAKHLNLLLYDRNKRWVEKFEELSKRKSILYAVGAGHLGGQKGVIKLLQQKGYTVRALKN